MIDFCFNAWKDISSEQLTRSFPKLPLVDNSTRDQSLALEWFFREFCMCALQICERSETTKLSFPHVVLPEIALRKGGQSWDLGIQGPRICYWVTCLAFSPDLWGCFQSGSFFFSLSRQQVIMACRSPLLIKKRNFILTSLLCSTRVSE